MLRTRLFFGLLPLLLVLVATGAYAIRVCSELAGPLQSELVGDYRSALGCQQMRTAATLLSNALVPPSDPIGARRDFEARRAAFTRELMAQSARSAGKPRQRLVEALDAAFTDFSGRCDSVLAGGASSSPGEFRENENALYRVLSAIDRLVANDYAASRQTEWHAEQLGNTAIGVLSIAIGAAIGLSMVLAWLLAASLLRPIKTLTASAVALGEGRLDVQVPLFSRDELGSLAQSFNTMASRLREYREATLARVLKTQRTMEATLTSAPDPLFVISTEGGFEVRNPAAEELATLPEFAAGLPPELAEPLAQVLATDEHYLPTDYAKVVTFRVGGEDRHYLPRILAIGDKLTEFKGSGGHPSRT